MDLKSRIENNLVLWLLGSLATGFMAGLGAYQGILEVAQLEVVSKTKLEDLRQEASLDAPNSSFQQETSSGLVTPPTALPQESTESTVAPEFKLSANPPFPKGLDSVRPGMRLSAARTVFPDGEIAPSWYSAAIDVGPFQQVAFFVYGFDNDPVVDVVNLQFRSPDSKRKAIEVLLRELGDRPHRTEMLGERIVWPDVNGYMLSVDASYSILLAANEDAGDV